MVKISPKLVTKLPQSIAWNIVVVAWNIVVDTIKIGGNFQRNSRLPNENAADKIITVSFILFYYCITNAKLSEGLI